MMQTSVVTIETSVVKPTLYLSIITIDDVVSEYGEIELKRNDVV